MGNEAPPLVERVAWVKAREAQLSGQVHGHPVGADDRPIGSEAGLLLTFPDSWTEPGSGEEIDQVVTVVVQGSFRRLLKTLDYARHQLLAAAPELREVAGYPDDTYPTEGEPALEGLQCPHCGEITWSGDEEGIRLVSAGEAWTSCGYALDGGRRLVHDRVDDADLVFDRYECEACERPVNLPAGIRD